LALTLLAEAGLQEAPLAFATLAADETGEGQELPKRMLF
jgi:hypothetical protein